MTPRQVGLALAVVHAGLVASLGAKLLADRASLPHGWARTAPFDPDLPIRGRYVRLRLEVPLDSMPADIGRWDRRSIRLESVDDRVAATLDTTAETMAQLDSVPGGVRVTLAEPVAFFIPEHIPDPSIRPAGEELWAEVTLPRRGPPRPIRLGVMKGGSLAPLEIR
jgi:hypothetical protein